MCYSLAFLAHKAAIYEKRYAHLLHGKTPASEQAWPVSYFLSGFSHPLLPLVTDKGILFYRWGLVPSWTKDAATAASLSKHTLNAVGETMFSKPSYRDAAKKHRGILGISGFFEWREWAGHKYPYFIHQKNNELLSLACLTSAWTDPASGEEINSFSVVTTPANTLLSGIHNTRLRMPLILANPQEEASWINNHTTTEEVLALVKPCPEDLLSAHTVSKQASNARANRNEPATILETHFPELPPLNNLT